MGPKSSLSNTLLRAILLDDNWNYASALLKVKLV
jgi:hypothetical protein